MKQRAHVGTHEAPSPLVEPRKLKRGPPITLTCECGERRQLRYGERWRCEACGRSWDTKQIPVEEYAALRSSQLRLRWSFLGVCLLGVACILIFIAIGRAFGGVILAAVGAMFWRMYIWPRQKQRYLEAIAERPSWDIRPE